MSSRGGGRGRGGRGRATDDYGRRKRQQPAVGRGDGRREENQRERSSRPGAGPGPKLQEGYHHRDDVRPAQHRRPERQDHERRRAEERPGGHQDRVESSRDSGAQSSEARAAGPRRPPREQESEPRSAVARGPLTLETAEQLPLPQRRPERQQPQLQHAAALQPQPAPTPGANTSVYRILLDQTPQLQNFSTRNFVQLLFESGIY